jgi:hypothetical protein
LKPSRASAGELLDRQSRSITPFVQLTMVSLQIRFNCLLGYDGLCQPAAEAQ